MFATSKTECNMKHQNNNKTSEAIISVERETP